MNKQRLIKDYPLPEMPEDIKKALKKRKAKNIAFVQAETKKIGKQMVNIVTFYKKVTEVKHYIKKTEIRYGVERYFISKNDYYQMEIVPKSWNDSTLVTKCTKRYYSPFGYWPHDEKYLPYDEKSSEVLQRMKNRLHSDDDLSLWDIVRFSIYNIEEVLRKERRAKKEAKDNAEMEESFKFFKKLPKAAYMECENHLPVYLYEEDNNCFCTSCRKDTAIDTLDKHLSIRKCPNCGAEAKVQLVRRCRAVIDEHEYMMMPEILDDNKYAIAYVLTERTIMKDNYRNYDIYTYESNRYINDSGKEFFYEHFQGKWNIVSEKNSNFSESARSICRYYENKHYCGKGYLYSKSLDTYRSLDGFEYYSKYNFKDGIFNLNEKDYYMHYMKMMIVYHKGLFLEKLAKVGLTDIIDYDNMYYLDDIAYNETSIIKMLKLNKSTFKALLKKKTFKDFKALQDIVRRGIPFDEKVYDKVGETSEYAYASDYEYLLIHKRILNYLLKQDGVSLHEYKHYIDNMKSMGYDIDKKINLYPKNFRKADERVTREIIEREAEQNKEMSIKIKLISDGLRNMPDIRDYMGGSNKLLVKIPESVEDLVSEGMSLSNCIGTYGEKISLGKTFIFFIRSADKPDEPFYAMEYVDGRIVQVRGFANKSAPEDVTKFCADFSKYLKKKKFNPKDYLKAA